MGSIAWNEDWMQYCGFLDDSYMNEKSLREWIRQYANSQVQDMVLNPNGMRVSYPSKARDYIAEGYDPNSPDNHLFFTHLKEPIWTTLGHFEFPYHLWMLEQKGLNHYDIWVDECHKCGLSPWFSMRMNDIHGVNDPSYYFHSKFWRDNPQFRCAEYRFSEGGRWEDRALDYAHPEVREHQFALIDEYIHRFDLDGLELDFLRGMTCFRPGYQEQGIEIMNDFIREVRQRLDQEPHGHHIKLGVRVPLQPEVGVSFGLDAAGWAKQGWIDQIVAMEGFGCHNVSTYDVWHRMLENTGVVLCGGLDIFMHAVPEYYAGNTTIETTRAFCSSMLYKGIEKIYLFNYMYKFSKIDEYLTMIQEVGDLNKIIGKPRRHVLGYADTAFGEPSAIMLPLHLRRNVVRDIRMHLGKVGEDCAEIRIASLSGNAPQVRLNGAMCTPACTIGLESPAPQPGATTWYYKVPRGAVHDGYNDIELTAFQEETIVWVEVYLH